MRGDPPIWLTDARREMLAAVAPAARNRMDWRNIHAAVCELPGPAMPTPQSLRVMCYKLKLKPVTSKKKHFTAPSGEGYEWVRWNVALRWCEKNNISRDGSEDDVAKRINTVRRVLQLPVWRFY